MLKFEGIKEFNIEKLDKGSNISRDFQLIFREDMLNEEECEIVEKKLNKHDFQIKDENIEIEVIYNIDLDTAVISFTVYCPLMHLNQISEEKISNFIDKHKTNFEEYYKRVKPY
jgi:hypothetical protein